jgi:hypothetical protein
MTIDYAGGGREIIAHYLCGPLRISASSALKNRLNAEDAEIRRGPQRKALRPRSEVGATCEDLVLRMSLHLEIELASLAVTLFVRRIVADDVSLVDVGKDP